MWGCECGCKKSPEVSLTENFVFLYSVYLLQYIFVTIAITQNAAILRNLDFI